MRNDQISDQQNLHWRPSLSLHLHHHRYTSYLMTTLNFQLTQTFFATDPNLPHQNFTSYLQKRLQDKLMRMSYNSRHQSKHQHKLHTKKDQVTTFIMSTTNAKQSQAKLVPIRQADSLFPPPAETTISSFFTTTGLTDRFRFIIPTYRFRGFWEYYFYVLILQTLFFQEKK